MVITERKLEVWGSEERFNVSLVSNGSVDVVCVVWNEEVDELEVVVVVSVVVSVDSGVIDPVDEKNELIVKLSSNNVVFVFSSKEIASISIFNPLEISVTETLR